MEWEQLNRAVGDPRVTPMPPICPNCGYNLTGAPRAVCPECGEAYSRRQVIREADRKWWEIRFQRDANKDASFGLILIAAGWIVRGLDALGGLRGIHIPIIPTLVVIVLALLGVLLGCRVFRLARLPEHARELLPQQPNVARGIMALISSAALLGSLCVGF